MLIAILQFIGLVAVIVVSGSVLARMADKIAEITGWGRMLIGGVLLAGATSLPELTVDITAVRLGLADLAAGDLLGSSLMNLLILAVYLLGVRMVFHDQRLSARVAEEVQTKDHNRNVRCGSLPAPSRSPLLSSW